MALNLGHRRGSRNFKKWLFSPFVLLFLFILVIFSMRGVYRVYQKELLSRGNLERTQAELKKVHDREVSLNDSVQYLKTSEGIDAEIRTKFRAVREGEEIAVIVVPEKEATTSVEQATVSVGFWGTIKGWFK